MAARSLDNLPTVFTHAQALAAGISNRDLYRMRDDGVIDRLARGLYTRSTIDADPDLVEAAVRAPKATLCLTSALAHHGLTDDIPNQIDIALPRSQRSPRTSAPIKWHRFDDDTFEVGRSTLSLAQDLAIGIYSPARTVIDAYRLRHLYGVDQAHESLKRWLRAPGNQPSELLEMLKSFPRAEPALRSALEVLL